MPEVTTMEDLYSAIEESAELVNVACSRDKVLPTLAAFGDGLAKEAMVVFAMAAGERHSGDIDYNFTVPPQGDDPYTVALANGLTAKTDHPVASLLSDLREHCAVEFYGVECGVVSGFKKTYVFFPLNNLQSMSKLAGIPSMPRSIGEHADTFARYGLDDRVSIIGIDYERKTMNVYFAAESVDAKTVLSLHSDIGLPEPSAPLLEFVEQSFSIYPTFSWDSSEIGRICYSVVTPEQDAYPAQIEPDIARFASSAPYGYGGERVLVYGATLSRSEEYHKLGVYYQKPPGFWNKLQLGNRFDKLKDVQ